MSAERPGPGDTGRGASRHRPEEDRGAAGSVTSTITGLPERYRPLDEVGPEERTDSGVIQCWRARDRVLNRDVAIRVHAPGGPPARAWISRALTAGGLATPALAMVYDASEGSGGPSGVAYVVNEWIEGQTLAERLEDGPMEERQARTVLRRLAEGVAEAHRVGLAVGGLSPETVVLRPNGLVGLRAVPAATGSVQDDIAALGALLEYCLTGRRAGVPGPDGLPPRPALIPQPDLAALVRRARSPEPGARLASAAAMAALLAERPRGSSVPVRDRDESDSGWLRRLREHRDGGQPDDGHPGDRDLEDGLLGDGRHDDDAPDAEVALHTEGRGATDTAVVTPVALSDDDRPQRLERDVLPPVPPARGPSRADDDALFGGLRAEAPDTDDDTDDDRRSTPSRRLLVVGLLVAALLVVVLLARWVGTNLLSVADDVDRPGSLPSSASSSAPAEESAPAPAVAAGPVPIASAAVFDPFGDGDPDNDDDVPASFDGDPATAWSTLTYRGTPAFGNLKPGVGVVYDLGSAQPVAAVTVTTTTPGVTVEVRTGGAASGALEAFPVAAAGTVGGTAELTLDEPVTTQYVLVWVTGLVPADDGFAGTLAEVAVTAAG